MNNKVLISVLITTYNLENYISVTLDSCLNQTLSSDKEIEVIIGDDGSTDNTLNIIKKYAQSYPNVFKYFVIDREKTSNITVPILRQSNVLKKALKICKGDFIQFLDGDDCLIDNDKLNVQADFLLNNPEYGSCYTNYQIEYEGKNEKESVISELDYNNKLFLSSSYMHVSCFLFNKNIKRYILENVVSDTGITYSGLCLGKCKSLDRVSFCYRKRPFSMSDLDKMKIYIYELLVAQDCMKIGNMKLYLLARYHETFKYIYHNYREFIENPLYESIKQQTKNSVFFNEKTSTLFSNKKRMFILMVSSFFCKCVVYAKKKLTE